MDRNRARTVRETIVDLIEDAMDSMGLQMVDSGARFSSTGVKVSFSFLEKEAMAAVKTEAVSQQEVDSGLAKPGTKLWAIDEGMYFRTTVLAVRRTKYLFEFKNYPELGKYTTTFRNLKVFVPVEQRAEGEE